MRNYTTNNQISVQAIAGTHVVMLGLNSTEEARKELLGFTIVRKDDSGEEKILGENLSFKGVSSDLVNSTNEATESEVDTETQSAASPVNSPLGTCSNQALIQAFLWSDYTAEPDKNYTYEITPVYGAPNALKPGDTLKVAVTTENPDDGQHGIFFNRGVAGSQAYARRFGEYRRSYRNNDGKWESFIKPDDVPDRKAYKWLSRGLEEGITTFIRQAKDSRYTIRASVYEFSYLPVIREFVAALERGVDVKIIHHCRKKRSYSLKQDYDTDVVVKSDPRNGEPEDISIYKNKTVAINLEPDEVGAATKKAIQNAGILNPKGNDNSDLENAFDQMFIERTHPAISHNKFIVLLKDDEPIQVWTGSTNFTAGGIFGQSNVGHLIRDKKTASAYCAFWDSLAKDPENKEIQQWTVDQGIALSGDTLAPPDAITPVFSPRANEDVLDWYAAQIGRAVHSVHLTSAFTISEPFLEQLINNSTLDENPETPYLRYVLLEGITGLLREKSQQIKAVPLNRVAWGDTLKTREKKGELVESLTGLNDYVSFLHTKYMLIDPLTDDPIIITGSANFSSASTTKNDENMVVIRGNKRVADIFLGEFMRLFNHYRVRNELNAIDDAAFAVGRHLSENDSWTEPYFDKGSELYQERLLFCQSPPPKTSLDLKYYMLDWDDNILFMPTKIHLVKNGQPVAISTKEYAEIQENNVYSFPDNSVDNAFAEFRDGTGDFVGDVCKAISDQAFAPSFQAFKRALCEARLFAIVTARGHSPETLREGVEVFIREALTDEERAEMLTNIQRYNKISGVDVGDDVSLSRYLDLNGYIGVSSPSFLKAYQNACGTIDVMSAASPQAAKTYAVQQFVQKTVKLANRLPTNSRQIAFGFSDDDLKNLSEMRSFIKDKLVEEFDTVHFFIYDTSGTAARVEVL